MNISACKSELPYPKVCVEKKNIAYAMTMMGNIGGDNSEMTAVSLYFYNHLVTCKNEKISEIFKRISVVEMHHMNIFGELTLQLGGDPRLWERTNRGMVYWSPRYNTYTFKLQHLLRNALNGELNAINKYKRQLEAVCDSNIAENLERIIIDEQIHVKIFKELIEEYK